jgi:uncharacterized BrkB/YihY/UPF0761 family membrane protein
MMVSPGLRLRILNRRANAYILGHPLAFALSVVKGFRANQGLLLAGAVAYYALLSIVPFLMLVVVVLSHFLDEAGLLLTLRRYLELLLPGQSAAIVTEVAHFLDERDLITWVLAATMVFFSSFAFTVLENAMSVIFVHRVAVRRRHFLVSALLPYCYILALGFGIMIVTLVTAALLWEIARHVLVWYFSTLSKVNVVYGSMSTAIVVMFSLEIGAGLLLFGAQVIAEYERVGQQGGAAGDAKKMETRPTH